MKAKALEPKGARNRDLEDAIVREPEADAAYLVYADWLQTEGDVRGELIALQHAAGTKSGPDAVKARRRASELLKAHADYFLGPLANLTKEKLEVEWKRGFLFSVLLEAGYTPPVMDVEARLRELLVHPSAIVLQDLRIGKADRENNDYRPIVKALSEFHHPALAALTIGRGDGDGTGKTAMGNVASLWSRLPKLRALKMTGNKLELGKIELPELRSFRVDARDLTAENAQSIAAAEWPMLESLSVRFGTWTPTSRLKDVQPILDGRGLNKLTSLTLMEFPEPEELCAALADGALAAQLEVLDLSLGSITDEGARLLAARKTGWPKLRKLSYPYNRVTKVGRKALSKLCPEINSLPQYNR